MTAPRRSLLTASPARAKVVLAIATVGVALAAADTYVVVLALTDMMSDIGVTIDALQKATPIISGFLLGYIAFLPLIGRLADLVDHGRVVQLCLLIFVLGSIVTAMAADLPVLVAGRVVQGIGGGGLLPATLALVAGLWPADRRGMPLGIVGGVQEFGAVLGPVLGAAILAIAEWRTIFWFNAVVGIVLSLTLFIVSQGMAREPASTGRRRTPRTPILLFTVGLALLFLALWAPPALVTSVTLGIPFIQFSGASGVLLTPIGLFALLLTGAGFLLILRAASPVLKQVDLPGALLLGLALGCIILSFATADPAKEVVGSLGIALLPLAFVCLGLYWWRHKTAAEPLIARGVVRGRVAWALTASFLLGAAIVAVIVAVPLLSRLTVSPSETTAAFELLKLLITLPVGAIIGGWVLRWFSDGLVAGLGMLLASVALWSASGWGRGSLDSASGTLGLLIIGLGAGLALTPINNAVLADAPTWAHGTASALIVVARMTGMVIGLALLTAIGMNRYYEQVASLDNRTDVAALVDAGIDQVQVMLFGAAVAAALAAISCFAMGLRQRRKLS